MRQIRVGTVLSYINIVLKNIVYLVYTPLLIKYVGQNSFGIYQLVTQVVATLSLFSMGFSGAYVHFYWIERKKGASYLEELNGIYLKIFLSISLVSAFFGIILVKFSSNIFNKTFSGAELITAQFLMVLMVLNVSVSFISTIFDSYIAANEKFIFQQSRILFTTIVQPIIVIPLLIFGMGVEIVAIVQLLLSIVLLIMNMIYTMHTLGMSFKVTGKSNQLIKSLFAFSSYLLINDMVDLINNNLPGVLVGAMLGPGSVAIYAIVVQIRSIFFQLSLALSTMFIPRVNKMVSENKDNLSFTKIMISVGKIQLTLLTLLCGGFIVLGKYFITFWAGSGFQKAYLMIIIVLLPAIIPLSQNIGIEIQRAKNKHKFRSIILAIFAVLNMVITFYGIKIWGVNGAILGYIISLTVGNGIIINLYNHFVIGLDMMKFWRSMSKTLLVSLISTVIGLYLQSIVIVDNFYEFILVGVLYVFVFGILWYFIAANDIEKSSIRRTILRI